MDVIGGLRPGFRPWESFDANIWKARKAAPLALRSLGFGEPGALPWRIWCLPFDQRAGREFLRAVGYRQGKDFFWFWIGSLEAYNKLLKR